MMQTQDIKISCKDGTPLSATLYTPTQTKGALFIAPATGIKRRFYASLAQFLAEAGYGVITFDNRGIGDSLAGPVKASDASLHAWGAIDMPAVLEALKQHFPNTNYHLIGHSAGGQLVGLMPNAHELTSMFNVACSSGRIKNMKMPFWLQAIFFMDVFIPLNNLLFGYTNSQWVGMGEPLPKKVAQDWREWCNGQGYVKTALGKTIHEHWYDELKFPSMWVNATDDPIANNDNVQDMIEVFAQLPTEKLTLKPSDYGLKTIGHMKFFSKRSKQLWEIALDWLEKHP